jgi:hypothetical protein
VITVRFWSVAQFVVDDQIAHMGANVIQVEYGKMSSLLMRDVFQQVTLKSSGQYPLAPISHIDCLALFVAAATFVTTGTWQSMVLVLPSASILAKNINSVTLRSEGQVREALQRN